MKKVLLAISAVALTIGGLGSVGVSPAGAEPVSSAAALAYGANLNLAGNPVVNRGGLATATVPPGADDGPNELVLVPAAPIAVSGTATGEANAHVASDIPTALTVVQQAVPGPYNARGVGIVEGLGVLVGAPPLGVNLVSATAVRAEAVGVCRGGAPLYSANSEVIDLNIAGTAVPLNGPLTDALDAVNALLQPLNMVADIERNVVATNPNGISVNALRVTVLGLGGAPLLDLVVGRAEATGIACGAAPAIPQCSDTQDNDGDGVIDANDPGCINNGVFDPNDNDETNPTVGGTGTGSGGGGGALARTGFDSSTTVPLAIGMSALALVALALRRRSTS